ncbi:transglutaminase TgpA family protein [Thalassolituus sp. LLYu03]|uniref:transglutaminase TgpA family protein n=1 Tax=Thalassolituus sp. LLYu03 TaxID=3421656 RepID=UPI003D2B79BA
MWGLAAFVLGWRWLTHVGRLSYPSRSVKAVAVVLATLAVVTAFGRSLSLESATAFLLAAAMLKLLEMRYQRDAYVVIFLSFFILSLAFLFDQGILSAAYGVFSVWLLICALMAVHRNSHSPFIVGRTAQKRLAKGSAFVLLGSLPMMLVLYLLFPRLAPLWGFNLQSEEAKTGLSEILAPGDIAKLGQSDELAFRVSFENNQLPPRSLLYWRALILDAYDGRNWKPSFLVPEVRWYPAGRAFDAADDRVIRYDVIQEATGASWLFALRGMSSMEERMGVSADDRLVNRRPVFNRLRYRVESRPDLKLDSDHLTRLERDQYVQFPLSSNPQAQQYAAQLRQRFSDDAGLLSFLMQEFNRQAFYYTLRPPALGDNDIDEFLFSTRRGFCAHYAGAFVFLARAAGIPARMVTGYQGGEWNGEEHYLTVRQYDAHAWTEAWLPGQGWVRFDPTAMVAPNRIAYGLEEAVREEGSFLEKSPFSVQKFKGLNLLNELRMQFDSLNYYWQRWVLSYDGQRQKNFLTNVIGLSDYENALYFLGSSFAVFFLSVSLIFWWRNRPAPVSPFMKAWNALQVRGTVAGVPVLSGETSANYLQRLAQQCPQQADDIRALSQAINAALYETNGVVSPALLRRIRTLKPRVARSSVG